MKLTFNRKVFQSALRIGGSYAGSNKVLPILGCVKISVINGKCWITSYDQQNAIKIKCDIIEYEGDIQFCIDSAYIQKHIACLEAEELELDIDLDKMIAIIISGTSTTQCPIENAEQYPTPINDQRSTSFKMDASFLLYWMSKGLSFLIDDEYKPCNECFHFIIKNKEVQLFATDLTKMYYAKMEINTDIETTLSIHKSAFKGLSTALKNESEITIQNGERNIVIIGNDKVLLIRKREMQMPPYERLLEYKPKFKVRVNKEVLIKALERASLISSNSKGALCTFEYSEKGIGLTTIDYDTGRKVEDFIETERCENISINYNTRHLLTTIEGISSEEIELSPTGIKTLLYVYNCDDDNELTATCPFM